MGSSTGGTDGAITVVAGPVLLTVVLAGCAWFPGGVRRPNRALVRYLCPIGAEVGFHDIADGGHSWPGSEFSRQIESVVGFTTFSINASDIM